MSFCSYNEWFVFIHLTGSRSISSQCKSSSSAALAAQAAYLNPSPFSTTFSSNSSQTSQNPYCYGINIKALYVFRIICKTCSIQLQSDIKVHTPHRFRTVVVVHNHLQTVNNQVLTIQHILVSVMPVVILHTIPLVMADIFQTLRRQM